MSRGRGKVVRSELYEKLRERDGLVCGICKGSLETNWSWYQAWLLNPRSVKRKDCGITIDHKYPKSLIRKSPDFHYRKGWSYEDMNNLQLAHWSCNNEKGDKVC